MSPLPAYRHSQLYAMLWLLLPATLALVVFLAALQRDGGAMVGLLLAGAANLGALALLGRLVIEVRGDCLHWRFGWLGWPRWSVPLAEIAAIERLRTPAIAGSGIKGTRRDRLCNVTIGGTALRLTLADGRRVTLGTPEPERLHAFLEARLPRRR